MYKNIYINIHIIYFIFTQYTYLFVFKFLHTYAIYAIDSIYAIYAIYIYAIYIYIYIPTKNIFMPAAKNTIFDSVTQRNPGDGASERSRLIRGPLLRYDTQEMFSSANPQKIFASILCV